MTAAEVVRELVALAEMVGIEVRIEAFGLRPIAGKGGLCRIRDRQVILVDAALRPVEQAGVIGQALGTVDLGEVAVPGELRPFLRTGHAGVKALVRPRPLARGRPR